MLWLKISLSSGISNINIVYLLVVGPRTISGIVFVSFLHCQKSVTDMSIWSEAWKNQFGFYRLLQHRIPPFQWLGCNTVILATVVSLGKAYISCYLRLLPLVDFVRWPVLGAKMFVAYQQLLVWISDKTKGADIPVKWLNLPLYLFYYWL